MPGTTDAGTIQEHEKNKKTNWEVQESELFRVFSVFI